MFNASSCNDTCCQDWPEKKMSIVRADLKWFQFSQRIFNWQNRYRSNQSARMDLARERSIFILQNRYGFDRAKAMSELERHYSKARLG